MLSCVAVLCFSQTGLAQSDIKEGVDHPLISRMPGTHITDYHTSDFQEFMIATGPISAGDELPPVDRFEGKSTVITYAADEKSLSALAIFRNFEKAFSKSGFEKVFSCASDKECGDKFVRQLYWYGDPQRQGQNRGLDAPNRHGARHTYFYWSGTARAEGDDYIVSLLVVQHTAMSFPAVIVLDVSQQQGLDDDQVVVNLEDMSDDMEKDGRVVLDGVYFDFDKSTLKPESKPALDAIAAYLNANPDRAFYVVGHTDSKGSLDYNKTLSGDRANAVTAELDKAYGVKSSQMAPIGVGPVSPVTTNSTEEGRARNRRVELVLRD